MLPPSVQHERNIVDNVALDTGLLYGAHTVMVRLRNAFEFTHECARRLSGDGWGLMLKTIGIAVDQCSVDSLVHRETGDVVTVLRNAGEANPQTCFELRPAKSEHLYIDPHAPESKAAAITHQEYSLMAMAISLRHIEDRLERDARRQLRREAEESKEAGARARVEPAPKVVRRG